MAWEDGLDVVPYDEVTWARIEFHYPAVRVYRRAGGDGRRRAAFAFPADRLTVHPPTAYALLRRYADDPAARAEPAYS